MAQPSEQFQGDMSRNEVEIDLNKFMAMVSEIGELKQTIMEMENEREPDIGRKYDLLQRHLMLGDYFQEYL